MWQSRRLVCTSQMLLNDNLLKAIQTLKSTSRSRHTRNFQYSALSQEHRKEHPNEWQHVTHIVHLLIERKWFVMRSNAKIIAFISVQMTYGSLQIWSSKWFIYIELKNKCFLKTTLIYMIISLLKPITFLMLLHVNDQLYDLLSVKSC